MTKNIFFFNLALIISIFQCKNRNSDNEEKIISTENNNAGTDNNYPNSNSEQLDYYMSILNSIYDSNKSNPYFNQKIDSNERKNISTTEDLESMELSDDTVLIDILQSPKKENYTIEYSQIEESPMPVTREDISTNNIEETPIYYEPTPHMEYEDESEIEEITQEEIDTERPIDENQIISEEKNEPIQSPTNRKKIFQRIKIPKVRRPSSIESFLSNFVTKNNLTTILAHLLDAEELITEDVQSQKVRNEDLTYREALFNVAEMSNSQAAASLSSLLIFLYEFKYNNLNQEKLIDDFKQKYIRIMKLKGEKKSSNKDIKEGIQFISQSYDNLHANIMNIQQFISQQPAVPGMFEGALDSCASSFMTVFLIKNMYKKNKEIKKIYNNIKIDINNFLNFTRTYLNTGNNIEEANFSNNESHKLIFIKRIYHLMEQE